MNRKQRRALGHSGAKPPADGGGIESGAKVAEMLGAAVVFHRGGALAEAERQYRNILALVPSHAEANGRLGAALMAQGKTAEAIGHLERAVTLKPDMFEAQASLAQAYQASGQGTLAFKAAHRALELRETPQGKTLFANCARVARFTGGDNGGERKWLARALEEDWAPPRELTNACLDLIKLDRAVAHWIGRANAAWPARLSVAELSAPTGLAALARDALLGAVLIRDPLPDVGFERLFTCVRRVMLAACNGPAQSDERFLDFFCAVARQCFLNEYVYALPETEAAQALALQSTLSEKIRTGETVPPLMLAAAAAYYPLYTVPGAQALCERSWPQPVEALIIQQIKEPADESRIAAALPALTVIEGEVSRAVRDQYEENPYPRWIKTTTPDRSPGLDVRPVRPAPDVLIAGCGTGLSLAEIAREAFKPRVLAVDLSRASLAYAQRMTEKLGLANIEFAQADITKLGALARQFDFIDASGVLHHLADPWEGWRVLLSLLRPGGTMQVGLYSELARANIVAARALIAERGYRAVADDIRRCREDIATSEDPLLRSLMRSRDFFTTSECRDLLFHAQEHRITLPAIKSFVVENQLTFNGFNVDPATVRKFAARFPGRAALSDLDCWHAFEIDAPETFSAMYQFQVQKPRPHASGARVKPD